MDTNYLQYSTHMNHFQALLFLSQLLVKYKRRNLYFLSTILSTIALCLFATCDLVLSNSRQLSLGGTTTDALKWSTLFFACLLVFSAQLGIQGINTEISRKMPNLEAKLLLLKALQTIQKAVSVYQMASRVGLHKVEDRLR